MPITSPEQKSSPTILYVDCSLHSGIDRRRLDGLRRYAAARKWRVETLEHKDCSPAALREALPQCLILSDTADGTLKEITLHSWSLLSADALARVLDGFKVKAEAEGYDITFISSDRTKQKMTYLEHSRYRGVDGVVIANVDFDMAEVMELIRS